MPNGLILSNAEVTSDEIGCLPLVHICYSRQLGRLVSPSETSVSPHHGPEPDQRRAHERQAAHMNRYASNLSLLRVTVC
eukprot:52005-Eustigmatos_ZCMA.PRE.1